MATEFQMMLLLSTGADFLIMSTEAVCRSAESWGDKKCREL